MGFVAVNRHYFVAVDKRYFDFDSGFDGEYFPY